jgi:hypothetical protein
MTSTDDLLLTTPFDQSIDTDDLTVLDRVDKILNDAILHKNAYIALDACKALLQVAKISGLGLAKILYVIYSNWDVFEIEESFESIVYEYIGLHKYTVNRYVRVWGMHQEKQIPEQFEEKIMQRNIKDQIPIATALKQGYKIDSEQWGKLADAADFQEVSQIVREDIKGKERKKGTLLMFLNADGSIWATKEGERIYVGSLQVHDKNELVQQAIQRIMDNTPIRESM